MKALMLIVSFHAGSWFSDAEVTTSTEIVPMEVYKRIDNAWEKTMKKYASVTCVPIPE